jgi:hypothetical protein
MTERPGPISPSAGPSQTVYWVLAVVLAVIAGALWARPGASWAATAVAQSPPGLAGARGIFAFTGPLDRDQYGLFMLDVDQGTIWCYAFDNVGGTSKLRLVAARTWVYDRYLQDFNCAAPDFRAVQKLVSQQRAQADASGTPVGREGEDSLRPAEDNPTLKE